MTQYELEQGLLVNAGSHHHDAPAVDGSMNIVSKCGAIVEVVDSRPQFVHFTVKEYVMAGPFGVGRLTHRDYIFLGTFSTSTRALSRCAIRQWTC